MTRASCLMIVTALVFAWNAREVLGVKHRQDDNSTQGMPLVRTCANHGEMARREQNEKADFMRQRELPGIAERYRLNLTAGSEQLEPENDKRLKQAEVTEAGERCCKELDRASIPTELGSQSTNGAANAQTSDCLVPAFVSPVSALQVALYWHCEREWKPVQVDEFGALLPRPKE